MIVLSVEQIREFVPIAANYPIETLKGDFNNANELYLEEVLGGDFLSEIPAIADSNPAANSPKGRFMYHYKGALCNLALHRNLPKTNVQISPNGVLMMKTEKQVSAFPWMVKGLLSELYQSGYDHINAMIRILEANLSQPGTPRSLR
jgi:hypothetical protein